MEKFKEEDIIYLAGFLDGEGCISLTRKAKKYIVPKVVIANTNIEVLKWIQEKFGGYFTIRKKLTERRRAVGYLEFQYRKALNLIKLIYPYLIVKKKQADIYFEYQKTIMELKDGTKNGLSHRTQEREELKNRMHNLNSWRR